MSNHTKQQLLPRIVGGILALIFVLAGCGEVQENGESVREYVIDEVEQFAGDPDVLFGAVSSIALDDEGGLYVLDTQVPTVHALEPDGEVRTMIGERGEGPGEFQLPGAVGVYDDSIRVVDMVAASISIFDREGTFERSVPVERHAGGHVFGPNGYYVGGNMGGDDSLAYVYDHEGNALYGAGTPVNTGPLMIDMAEVSDQIDSGEIPDIMADMTVLAPDEDGGLWLIRRASGEVVRYSSEGEQRWSTTLQVPEGDEILEYFFASNRENSRPTSFVSLSYFTDAQVVGDELWLLVGMPTEAEYGRIMVVADDGSLSHHLIVQRAAAARSLAVDETRGHIYLGVPSMAAVLRAAIPDEV